MNLVDELIDVLDWVDGTTADTVLALMTIFVVIGVLLIAGGMRVNEFLFRDKGE